MAEMEPESVQCVVTSPPYLGLRDYGIAPSVWGGEAHEHEWVTEVRPTEIGRGNWSQGTNGRGELQPGGVAAAREPIRSAATTGFCPCGAWLGVLGLEPTVELYVAHMVEVFRGVRRVLRKDGTVWLNLGDSYASNGSGGGSVFDSGRTDGRKSYESDKARGRTVNTATIPPGLKPKDRMMIPARVAIALQADGWWLRDEIVWHKPNPMPSSVTDRTTPAHEMVYLLTKSARYFYDAEAIAELSLHAGEIVSLGGKSLSRGQATGMGREASGNGNADEVTVTPTRNKRSVWTIPTAPYPEAHFATFPPKLIEPMILAGSKPGDVVLDPFGGSGTVGVVAQMHSRRAVLIDLNPDYLAQQMTRNAQSPLGLETA
jgi:DNA modification methylase